MKTHPLAQIIPPLTPDEIERLEASLKHGFDPMKPIITLDGMILDGRHRAEIAARLGVEPTYAGWVPAWEGDTPAGFVARSIIHRSLSATQRATIAAELLPHIESDAAKRMKAGKADPTQKIVEGRSGRESTAVAAKATGTNREYVAAAAKIKEKSPATFEAMKAGTVSMAEAKKAVAPKRPAPSTIPKSTVPPEAQEALDAIPAFKEAVNAIRACKRQVEELSHTKPGVELAARWKAIEAHLHNAAEMVKFSTPHSVCPYMPNCEVNCKTCKGRKWVDRVVYDLLPEAIRGSK